MSIADKLTTVAENVPKVYKAAEDEMWRGIINERTYFTSAFERWQLEYIRPPIKIVPIDHNGAAQMCRNNKKLKIIEADYFDFRQMKTGTTTQSGLYYAFAACDALTEIEDIGIGEVNPISTFSHAFYYCNNLRTVAKITVAETSKFGGTFDYCRSLENITFAGTIGQNGLNIQWSPLSHDSLMSIINALADKSADTSTTWTVTIGETNKAKLTTDELSIASNKGWQVQ